LQSMRCRRKPTSSRRMSFLSRDCESNWLACLQLSIFEIRPVSFRQASFAQPVQFQTFPQSHTGAIQHHPGIGRADLEFLTNFFIIDFLYFAHEEYACKLVRQAIHALLQYQQELLLLELIFW